jgi:uncharacterized metal-binding protein YceD (DUF177 family)
MEKTQNAWSVPVAVEDIPDTGVHIEVDAPEPVRAALAASAGVRELPRLSAAFDLAREGLAVRVTGQVNARVGQKCIVTLELIETDLGEPVDLVFAPPEASQMEAGDADEPPEPLIDGKLDLGAIATEFLFLGVDPYPRKAGAEFAPVNTDDGRAHPFAGLEALKKRLGGG